MARIAFLLGAGHPGDDVLHKVSIIKHLAQEHEVFAVSRFDAEILTSVHLESLVGSVVRSAMIQGFAEIESCCTDYAFMYDSPSFRGGYSDADIQRIETWLGVPVSFLTSLDRRFFDTRALSDKRKADGLRSDAVSMIEFFREYFSIHRIQVLVNTLEDDLYSMTAYFTAKRLGIRILGLMEGRFPRRGKFFCDDFTDISCWIDEEPDIGRVRSLYDNTTFAGASVQRKNLEYMRPVAFFRRFGDIQTLVNFRRYSEFVIGLSPAESSILPRLNSFSEALHYAKSQFRRVAIRLLLSRADHSERYFLFPLHFANDAQMTFREPFVDQFDLIMRVARVLPAGCKLYIKPHPHHFGTDVSFRRLAGVSKHPSIRIVDPLEPPLELLKSSMGVITLNSTTGFEAMIFRVPVVTFGHDFFCRDDLCHVVRDLHELPELLTTMSEKTDDERLNSAEAFTSIVFSNTIWVDGIEYDYGVYGLTDQDGLVISKALSAILNKTR